MKPTDIILKTKELIERDGWIQGEHRDDAGRRCLSGALCAAAVELVGGPPRIWYDPYCAAYNRLMEFVGSNPTVADWNDAPGRTKAEVLNLLTEAAQ